MQLLKVSCSRCMHYNECSQETRLYVNYCGTSQKVLAKIEKAVSECRARHGYLFQRFFVSESEAVMSGTTPAVSLST